MENPCLIPTTRRKGTGKLQTQCYVIRNRSVHSPLTLRDEWPLECGDSSRQARQAARTPKSVDAFKTLQAVSSSLDSYRLSPAKSSRHFHIWNKFATSSRDWKIALVITIKDSGWCQRGEYRNYMPSTRRRKAHRPLPSITIAPGVSNCQ
jgi:hypothetical protein